ncbi:MAG: S8 family serine peptidase [Muribaculaceae bacterium]|nr:S8 family serine peptidase [Muribaculaceae bacterium]
MRRFLLFFSLICLIVSLEVEGADEVAPYIPQIVKIQNEAEVDSLESRGVEIMRRRGDILLCLFPNVSTRGGGARIFPPRTITPTLDIAKTYYDAGSIQTGEATGTPYTGKGVVVGICDIGIDPLHPTFLDNEGRSRIKRVVQYVEREGLRIQLDGDEAYREWVTDNPDEYHATHVCGILAGGGAGSSYSGIATDAEIVVTVSTLTDVGLLAGVEDIIDYAKETGRPAVINMSMGSYTGPHDGSSLFSQYLDMCAEDAVIVLSAGNEGAKLNTLSYDFSSGQHSVAFRLGNRSWDQLQMYGATDIWSGSSSPLEVSIGVYDTNVKKVERWLDPVVLTGGDFISYPCTGADVDSDELPFEGELIAEGRVDPENGRHRTTLGYEFTSSERASDGGWARYVLAVKVSGEPGEEVEVYADGTYTRLIALSGNPAPSTDRSISDLACGFNVVSVGMYGNRDSIPVSTVDGGIEWHPTEYRQGCTVVHSSYGTLRDGRLLPLTVAPGATLMSAASRPYFSTHPDVPCLTTACACWVDEGGTSMSAPYVAGYIATWLEAVPTLTSADVRRIIAESNRIDIPDPDDPRNGMGYFDPVRGLRLALEAGRVESLPDIGLSPDDYVEVFDPTGVKRYAGAASGLSCIGKGLYVVRTPKGLHKKMFIGEYRD